MGRMAVHAQRRAPLVTVRWGPFDFEWGGNHAYIAVGWRRWIGISLAWGKRGR